MFSTKNADGGKIYVELIMFGLMFDFTFLVFQ
jgi:hypothetical protein